MSKNISTQILVQPTFDKNATTHYISKIVARLSNIVARLNELFVMPMLYYCVNTYYVITTASIHVLLQNFTCGV